MLSYHGQEGGSTVRVFLRKQSGFRARGPAAAAMPNACPLLLRLDLLLVGRLVVVRDAAAVHDLRNQITISQEEHACVGRINRRWRWRWRTVHHSLQSALTNLTLWLITITPPCCRHQHDVSDSVSAGGFA